MGKHHISDKEKLFRTQIGQAATVKREAATAEAAAIPNRKLADLGIEMNPVPSMRYRGSAAVHIYSSDIIDTIIFVSQTQPLELYRCPENLAAKAFEDLVGSMKELYGKRRAKLRSGF